MDLKKCRNKAGEQMYFDKLKKQTKQIPSVDEETLTL